MPGLRMKSVSRGSISDEFEVSSECPIPETPQGGARVKVHYAGACYTEQQVEKSGQKRLRSPGVLDTSLFPGFEVSGVVDDICNTLSDTDIQRGDRVILYSESDDEPQDGSYTEYISVSRSSNLIKIPPSLPLDVASMLPSGALQGYAAALRAKPFIQMKSQQSQDTTNLLIVGAGGLGLWTLKIAQFLVKDISSSVKISIADTNVDKLEVAKDHGCLDVIHWNDAIYEEYLLERTKNVCGGGVDVVIDFVSSPRSINRSLKVMRKEGVLLVGGNSKYDVPVSPTTLAINNFCMLGIQKGTREQLEQLVQLLTDGQLKPPIYQIFPVDEANRVFDMLNSCKIDGRAILEICAEEDEPDGDEGEFSVFLPSPESETKLSESIDRVPNGRHTFNS